MVLFFPTLAESVSVILYRLRCYSSLKVTDQYICTHTCAPNLRTKHLTNGKTHHLFKFIEKNNNYQFIDVLKIEYKYTRSLIGTKI